MRGGRWLLFAGLIVAGYACAHGRSATAHAVEVQPDDSTVVLVVTNYYTLTVDIYAAASGTSYRMGTVSPGIVSQFKLRQALLGNGLVEFTAEPADGAYTVRSGELLLEAGDVVDFVIANHLRHSTATVRP
jgi:hypothetical protein